MDLLQNELYFKTAESELELERCFRLRYQVYCAEKQWLSPSNFKQDMEFDEYDKKSVHVMALDEDFKLVGVMRILPGEYYSKLPFHNHPGIRGKNSQLTNMAELSRFIVSTDKNNYHVTRGLLRAVYQTSVKMGIENWVFMLEPSLLRFLGMFKFYLDPIGTPAMYFGAFTMVASCNIPYTEKMWKTKDSDWHSFYKQDAVIMLPVETTMIT